MGRHNEDSRSVEAGYLCICPLLWRGLIVRAAGWGQLMDSSNSSTPGIMLRRWNKPFQMIECRRTESKRIQKSTYG